MTSDKFYRTEPSTPGRSGGIRARNDLARWPTFAQARRTGYARFVQQWDTRQKNLLLILARDVASKIATPMFVVDAEGTLVFFNEAAEPVLGQTFADTGELKADEWMDVWRPCDFDRQPIPPKALPLGIALYERRPAHREFMIAGTDGVERHVAATALPLLARRDELVGAVALFWDQSAEAKK
jgi:PAS domain-containing protein